MKTAQVDQVNSSNNQAAGQNGGIAQQLFTGDLDSAALAAEEAELERLVASMEETLEDNEVDRQIEQDEFSMAARITTETFATDDILNVESIALKVFNEATDKMLADQEDDFRNPILPTDDPSRKQNMDHEQDAKKSFPDDSSAEDNGGDSTSEDGGDDGGYDDLSIDDSVASQKSTSSSKSSSSEASSDDESKAENNSEEEDDDDDGKSLQSTSRGESRLHGSTSSLSIFEIHDAQEENTEDEHDVWIQQGILRVDESSEKQAFICDWDRFRKWKKRKLDTRTRQHTARNGLESSSQRWADRSAQEDSGLKMPRRRASDSTHGTRSTTNNDNNDNNNAAVDADDNTDESASVFDWKAWRRRKDGHVSSTSRTNSFSVSAGDMDDEFDANSVLAKLDEWEVMMEESNKTVTIDTDDNSATSPPADATETGGSLNRADSEAFASRRTSLPVRSKSEHSIQVNEEKVGNRGDIQWKDWRREQRKMRLGGSWSNLSAQLSPGSDAGGANDDFTGDAASENGRDVPDLPCQSPVNRTQSEKVPAANRSPNEQMARSNSFVLKRTFQKSPLRSPGPKSAMQQSPIGADWKKWQREKRRSGIWKRTFSDRDSWGLPFNDDKAEPPENNSHADDASNSTCIGPSKREKLTTSLSERWDANCSVSDSMGAKRRGQLQRAHSVPSSKEDAKNGVFDWKSWRKDKERPELERSRSDRWSSSITEAADKIDKPPAPPSAKSGMRRSQSEKWDNVSSNTMPEAAPQSRNQPPDDSPATGTFDWKGWKKDKRKSLRKTKSAMLTIGSASQ
jgi:hypothetical protein